MMGSPCDYLSASLVSFQRPICQKKFKNIPPEHDKRVNSRCLRTRHAPSSGSSSEVTSMFNIGSGNEKMQHYRRRAAKVHHNSGPTQLRCQNLVSKRNYNGASNTSTNKHKIAAQNCKNAKEIHFRMKQSPLNRSTSVVDNCSNGQSHTAQTKGNSNRDLTISQAENRIPNSSKNHLRPNCHNDCAIFKSQSLTSLAGQRNLAETVPPASIVELQSAKQISHSEQHLAIEASTVDDEELKPGNSTFTLLTNNAEIEEFKHDPTTSRNVEEPVVESFKQFNVEDTTSEETVDKPSRSDEDNTSVSVSTATKSNSIATSDSQDRSTAATNDTKIEVNSYLIPWLLDNVSMVVKYRLNTILLRDAICGTTSFVKDSGGENFEMNDCIDKIP
ncbi:hypothetical protein T4B_12779 [Trichinella pseudospiralis]|uniref:Uncharacterized protein n=1 Tax=Trichinella pseudospiralis TaxID=6337 RepID=A0A0V1JIQ8_TRIPS|nr:hypothetical protein T4A_11858 [Trichinella pseudospiralis]KRZ12876.1 hypothetical protein T4B_12779 [Trichinella pseudospiralis]KRZ34843.1 hypothetical protein T4C_13747 [Trichinella pseudospiralis]